MAEIAEVLDLPDDLRRRFHVHGYYGTVNHNASLPPNEVPQRS